MNEFLIFHSPGNTPGATVERIRGLAKKCPKSARKKVRVMAVDIGGSHPNMKHRQTNRLIECTTVADGVVIEHDVNPTDDSICQMIANLP